MKILQINELSSTEFRKYGDFISLPEVDGTAFGSENDFFHPDFFQLDNAGKSASVSLCRVSGTDHVVRKHESHSATCEGILPIDGDILLPVARPHWMDQSEQFTVFRVPQGTFVRLKAGCLHSGPFSATGDTVNVLILLPERTYANDSHYSELDESKWFSFQ